MRKRWGWLNILCVLSVMLLFGCDAGLEEVSGDSGGGAGDGSVDLANPASVYCEEQGGTLDIRTDADGGQYGVCVFSGGTECEEWAFFRGDCVPSVPEPQPQPDQSDQSVPGPIMARDAALAYIRDQSGESAPDAGLTWTEANITPEGMVGETRFRYTSGAWEVTVSFPLVAPQATIYTVQVANSSAGLRWEGQVDAAGLVIAVADPLAEPVSGWLEYQNTEYGFAFRYPATWALEESPGGEEVAGRRASPSVTLRQGTLRLLVQYQRPAEAYALGPGGRAAGEVHDRGTVDFLGHPLPRHVLVFEDKDKSVFYGERFEDLEFYIQLDDTGTGHSYEDVVLSQETQAEVDQILESFTRLTL